LRTFWLQNGRFAAVFQPLFEFAPVAPDRPLLLVNVPVDRKALGLLPAANGPLALAEVGGNLLPRFQAIFVRYLNILPRAHSNRQHRGSDILGVPEMSSCYESLTGEAANMHFAFLLLLADWRDDFRRAETYLQQGRPAEAKRAFAVALKGGTDLAAIFDGLGRADFAAGHFLDARHWFEKAVREAPESAAAWGNLARTHLELKDYKAAKTAVQQALMLAPESSTPWSLNGQICFKIKDFEGAESSFQTALKGLPPGQARARILANLGHQRWQIKDKAGAAKWLGQALKEMATAVGPDHPDTLKIRADYEASAPAIDWRYLKKY
jgi:tetratricopeptide (TPR) repeat protein